MRKSERPREQAAATRTQILAVAQLLFERDGYAATSMAAVAADAPSSSPTASTLSSRSNRCSSAPWLTRTGGSYCSLRVGGGMALGGALRGRELAPVVKREQTGAPKSAAAIS